MFIISKHTFFNNLLIDRWWGFWSSYESQPFWNEDPLTSHFEWKGICHQYRYVKKGDSVTTHQIQCIFFFKSKLNEPLIWCNNTYCFSISYLHVQLSHLYWGTISANEGLYLLCPWTNGKWNRDYQLSLWEKIGKMMFIEFFTFILSTCYCKAQMFTVKIRQTTVVYFSITMI